MRSGGIILGLWVCPPPVSPPVCLLVCLKTCVRLFLTPQLYLVLLIYIKKYSVHIWHGNTFSMTLTDRTIDLVTRSTLCFTNTFCFKLLIARSKWRTTGGGNYWRLLHFRQSKGESDKKIFTAARTVPFITHPQHYHLNSNKMSEMWSLCFLQEALSRESNCHRLLNSIQSFRHAEWTSSPLCLKRKCPLFYGNLGKA